MEDGFKQTPELVIVGSVEASFESGEEHIVEVDASSLTSQQLCSFLEGLAQPDVLFLSLFSHYLYNCTVTIKRHESTSATSTQQRVEILDGKVYCGDMGRRSMIPIRVPGAQEGSVLSVRVTDEDGQKASFQLKYGGNGWYIEDNAGNSVRGLSMVKPFKVRVGIDCESGKRGSSLVEDALYKIWSRFALLGKPLPENAARVAAQLVILGDLSDPTIHNAINLIEMASRDGQYLHPANLCRVVDVYMKALNLEIPARVANGEPVKRGYIDTIFKVLVNHIRYYIEKTNVYGYEFTLKAAEDFIIWAVTFDAIDDIEKIWVLADQAIEVSDVRVNFDAEPHPFIRLPYGTPRFDYILLCGAMFHGVELSQHFIDTIVYYVRRYGIMDDGGDRLELKKYEFTARLVAVCSHIGISVGPLSDLVEERREKLMADDKEDFVNRVDQNNNSFLRRFGEGSDEGAKVSGADGQSSDEEIAVKEEVASEREGADQTTAISGKYPSEELPYYYKKAREMVLEVLARAPKYVNILLEYLIRERE